MTTDPSTLVVERHVAAAPSAVYAYFTDAERWARWQGDQATIDATPGGLFRILMGNGMCARGQFVELVPDKRLVFTWGWIDLPDVPPGSTVVEIDLEQDGDGTLMRLTHRDMPADHADMHRVGWVHYLARLAVCATGGDPGPDPGAGG
ncbi:SRPBCC family protein [soil metagenome]